MIKANELRIGNFILYAPNEKINMICKVFAIDDKCVTAFDNDLPLAIFKQESIKGIALTPEILEKCGFERLPNFNIMNSMVKYLPRKRHLSFGCVGTPNEMLVIQEIEDDKNSKSIIVLHNYDYNGYMHLHQLQNIYFALTGEELQYNK